ncbi:FtsW/RodA/SpoVE family cell cycle protein [Boudabousia marimammalium]|uniref:Cell division protein n=1 Tax=Boudabousia marimammalium TaxID=156892 RepID=A0A1Q5PSK4_9ACTO|nr:FtsW/RodA/SpoVE family cell cycle protein [Boudabousia marimammalium]OKL50546.1 cell division protein [Boudabousia marimammalium]
MATISVRPARPGRLPELFLMFMAVLIGVGGYAATAYSRTGTLPQGFTTHIAAFLGLAVVASVLVKIYAPYADPVIMPVAVALNGLGLAMIYRLDQSYIEAGKTLYVTGTRQLTWTFLGIGVAALILILLTSHRRLRTTPLLWMILSLILLVSPLIPFIGRSINGATIWVKIGPISGQPAELAKVTLAIAFAGYLVAYRDRLTLGGKKFLGIRLPRLQDLGPLVIVWAMSIVVLVLQRDLGTSLLLFGLFVAMLYVATDRVSWIVLGLTMFFGAAAVAVQYISHVGARITVWLHTFDPDVYSAPRGSWQLAQAQFGMASGGMFGYGWGRGYPTEVYAAHSDMILASFGEELGLTGLLAIFMLYLILLERGMRAAVSVRDGFGKLLATGLTFSIAFQLFVVGGGILRIIPLTGLTAPFLAAGGSSLVSSWIIVALLLRLSDAARRPAEDPLTSTRSVQKLSNWWKKRQAEGAEEDANTDSDVAAEVMS